MPEINLRFDRRFGTIYITTDGPGQWTANLTDILRQAKLRPEELAGFQEMAEFEAETRPLEQICREAIAALDLKGKNVLDIGGYDGRMAAYAKELGAERAICLDSEQWTHYGWTEQDKLPGVEYVTGDFMELGIHREEDYPNSPYAKASEECIYRTFYEPRNYCEKWPRPDVIIFYNVLYHLKHPWESIERLRTMLAPGGTMLLCTLVKFDNLPRWELFEPFEVNPEDDTVYWGPSKAGLLKLLKLTGWQTEVQGQALERLVVKCW